MKTKNSFIGKEVEGPDKGVLTFFLPRGATAKASVTTMYSLIKASGVSRIYFGAGEERNADGYDWELIEILKALPHITAICIEVDSIEEITASIQQQDVSAKVEFILVIETESVSQLDICLKHIKLQDKNYVYWYVMPEAIVTKTDDPLYDEDATV